MRVDRVCESVLIGCVIKCVDRVCESVLIGCVKVC